MSLGPQQSACSLSGPDVAALNQTIADQSPQTVLSWLHENGDKTGGPVPLVSSFGADSVVLIHMVSQISRDYPILFIDTRKHFDETLSYRDQLINQFGLTNLTSISAAPDHLKEQDPFGALWMSDPDACCDLRKTVPLDLAMQDFPGWITGRKRFQTSERSQMDIFELDKGKLKVNPLANWGPENVADYVKSHSLPGHPLIPKGFLSIGCAPCTSPVADGEDARAGRWKGQMKTECGLHVAKG
ncbi:MAG: phosphoadenylyl-sulfate reductase [Cohaesibacter sp.]|jgi:phosphoadenosine phosphosulfate reductase|nr:phosphoadenylyl-sulfate reductase [Cohaesibacter sp.]